MSLLRIIKTQLGLSVTPANNFTLDASADNGTMKLARGNAGATTQDVMTVDAAGKVAFPQNAVPAFSAYASVATSAANNGSTKILFQTEEYDTTNAYDSVTNSRFQPTTAGYYQIDGNVLLVSAAAGIFLSIYKNGAEYKRGSQLSLPSNGSFGASVSAQVYLNGSTDYVELNLYQASGAAILNYVASPITSFQGCLIRSA